MGTNATIMVVGSMVAGNINEAGVGENQVYNQARRFYRSMDGYPQQTLSQIIKACARIEAIMSRRYDFDQTCEVERPTPEVMALFIQAETVCMAGYIDATMEEVDFLANDCDFDEVDWFYVVDCNLLAVNVFSVKKLKGRYSDFPAGHMELGFYDLVKDIQHEVSMHINQSEATADFHELKKKGDQLRFWKVNQIPDVYSKPFIEKLSTNNLVKSLAAINTEGAYAF